jgi:aminoglycoside phosphotransferase (APT) family kinase protein
MSNPADSAASSASRLELVRQLVEEILPASQKLERVVEGVSTEVYRVWHNGDVLYLRILPEEGASFVPEARVHRLLCERGIHVPHVIHVEHCHPLVQRSVMLTTAIEGHAVGYGAVDADLREVIVRAGQELAAINSISVDGFGWVRRDACVITELQAEFPSLRTWLEHELDGVVATLRNADVLDVHEQAVIEQLFVRYAVLLDDEQAYLAHGDFDVTHIYHQQGCYTGIIDFGEIRGANQLYDLGHFAIENNELLPWLLEGYHQVYPLPADYMERIALSSLWIALRRSGRRLQKGPGNVYLPDLDAIRHVAKLLHS